MSDLSPSIGTARIVLYRRERRNPLYSGSTPTSHRLWDGLITSTNNIGRLRNIATELLSKFSRVGLKELDQKQPHVWAKESYEIAVKISYENGNLRGTPQGQARDCRDVQDANFISRGYPGIAKLIADRRVYLAGYRMAELLERITGE
jgi:S1/P1 Nuclease